MRKLPAVLFGLAIVVVGATPASAHTISGPRPTNYRARVVSVTPPAPGISVRVIELGAKLQMTNTTSSDVIVLGADGEQYLRIGPTGVYENLHSASTYINKSLKGGVIPHGVNTDPKLAPEWHKISDSHTARWHYHGAHWMEPTPPPIVQASPNEFHRLVVSHLLFTHNGTQSDAAVELAWVPGPSSTPWIPVIAGGFIIGVALVLLRRWWPALGIALVLLVANDALHAVTYEMSRAGSIGGKVLQFFGGSFVSIFVWIAAVPTLIGVWRRRADARYGVLFVGLMFALVGGVTDLSALWKSQLPTVGSYALARLEVATALGVGAGLAIGALVSLLLVDRPERATPPNGSWLSTLVVGLDESELRRIAAELDVEEVLDVALHELVQRLEPCAHAFGAGAFVIDVVADDEPGRHTWSIAARDSGLQAMPGRADAVRAEIGVSFPMLLQMFAGTLTLDDAIASHRVTTSGDIELLTEISPLLSERALTPDRVPTDVPASAP